MINCPRCEQPVDETVRTTCPLCFTPLQPEAATPQTQPGGVPATPGAGVSGDTYGAPAAPPLYQPAAPPSGAPAAMPLNAPSATPARSANTRMTLNGDIIEAPPTPAAAPAAGNYAPRPAAPRPNYGTSARVETRAKSGGGAAAVVAVLLLILLGGGFGGYYWWMHRTTPKDTVTKYLTAVKTQDWKTIYELTEPNDQMKKYTSAQDFADKVKAQMDAQPGASQLISSLFSGLKFEVQEPKSNDGSTATVPVKLTVNFLGRDVTQTQEIKLKMDGGIWKVSASGAMGLSGGLGGGLGAGRAGGLGGFGGR